MHLGGVDWFANLALRLNVDHVKVTHLIITPSKKRERKGIDRIKISNINHSLLHLSSCICGWVVGSAVIVGNEWVLRCILRDYSVKFWCVRCVWCLHRGCWCLCRDCWSIFPSFATIQPITCILICFFGLLPWLPLVCREWSYWSCWVAILIFCKITLFSWNQRFTTTKSWCGRSRALFFIPIFDFLYFGMAISAEYSIIWWYFTRFIWF